MLNTIGRSWPAIHWDAPATDGKVLPTISRSTSRFIAQCVRRAGGRADAGAGVMPACPRPRARPTTATQRCSCAATSGFPRAPRGWRAGFAARVHEGRARGRVRRVREGLHAGGMPQVRRRAPCALCV